jgi:hypothetical protein
MKKVSEGRFIGFSEIAFKIRMVRRGVGNRREYFCKIGVPAENQNGRFRVSPTQV